MNYKSITTNNGARVFTWDTPGSNVFFVKFSFYLNNTTLPFKYDQALHLLEHILGRTSLAMQNEGAIVNARTSQDDITFYCSLPAEYLSKSIDCYVTALFYDNITESALSDEMKAVKAEMSRTLLSPKRRLNNLLHSKIQNSFTGSNYAIESLENINLDVVNQLRKELIQPNNLVVYLSGKIDGTLDKIVKDIEQIPQSDDRSKILIPVELSDLSQLKDGLSQSPSDNDNMQMQFIWLLPFCETISQRTHIVFEILNKFLRSNDKESFFTSYRRLGLAYDLFTGISRTAIPSMDAFQIFGIAKDSDIEKIVDLFNDRLRYLISTPNYINDRIEQYKRSLLNNRILQYQTPMQVAERGAYLYERDGSPIEHLEQINDISTYDIVNLAKSILSYHGFIAKVNYK